MLLNRRLPIAGRVVLLFLSLFLSCLEGDSFGMGVNPASLPPPGGIGTQEFTQPEAGPSKPPSLGPVEERPARGVATGSVKPAAEATQEEIKQPEQKQPEEVKPKTQASIGTSNAVSFFFDDADIFEVVQTVFGDILKANYLIDPKVKGKVNFRTITPIPREEVLPVMEMILRINGIGFVEEKGMYRIVPLTDVSKELVYSQVGKDPGKVALELFAFKNVNLKEAMPDIENAIGLNVQGGTVKIMPIQRLNALLAITSTKEQMDYIRKWVEAFDGMFAEARPKVTVYPLQNSKAGPVSSILQSILGGGGGGASTPAVPAAPRPATAGGPAPAASQLAPQPPRTGSTVVSGGSGFLVSPDTRIFADEINNTLVILATPGDYAFIEETIKKIDVLPRQVIIEGLIVRVELHDNLSFGFAWSFRNDINITGVFKRPITLGGESNINPGIITNDQGTQVVPSKGFTFIGTDPSGKARAVITALADESKAKVLAAPHILVADNREARIQVGSQVPLSTSTTTTPISVGTTTNPITNTSTSTIQYKDIGIILKVKPQINDSGLVSIELTQEVSSIGSNVKIAGQDFASIDKEEVTSNLIAQDGETIIIGGLIREDTTKAKDGIPFLNKIPILGNLFGNTTDNKSRSEIIVLLTPRVLKNLKQAEDITSGYIDKYKESTKDKEIDQFIQERSKKDQKEKSGGDAGNNNPQGK